MLRVFQNDMLDSRRFVVTLELVPGRESTGRSVDTVNRTCIWFRAHNRLAAKGEIQQMCDGCVPPRMWELDETSSWINFHLGRDHQGSGNEIAGFCRQATCRLLVGDGGRKAESEERKSEDG